MSDLGPTELDCLKIIVTQLQRNYDVLLVLLADTNREAYENIVAQHKDFKWIGPEPWVE